MRGDGDTRRGGPKTQHLKIRRPHERRGRNETKSVLVKQSIISDTKRCAEPHRDIWELTRFKVLSGEFQVPYFTELKYLHLLFPSKLELSMNIILK